MRALLISVAGFLSLASLWPVYGTLAAVIVAASGTVLGTGVAFLAARRRWALPTTALFTLLVFYLVGVPLAVPSKALFGILPSLDGLLSLSTAIVLSWKQLVTVVTPVASYEALLVPLLLLALVGSVIGVSLALRPKTRIAAALIPFITLALAIWLGPVRGFESALIAGTVFLLVVVWFAVSGPRGGRGVGRAVAVIALPVGVALVVVSLTIPTQRDVWRVLIEQPFVVQTDTSPLAEYRAYVTGEGANQTLLQATGLEAGALITLATLDRYDGVVYSVGGTAADFTRVPGAITPEVVSGDPVDSSFTITSISGPWVPLPAELGSVTFEGRSASALTNSFYYSRPAATGAVLGGLAPGDRYRVVGQSHPFVSLTDLAQLTPGTANVPAPTVIPDGIDTFLTRNAEAGGNPGARLANVLSALVAEGYVSDGAIGQAPSRSGHGAERITQLFTDQPMVGDAEQYSAAAALLATQAGFPARVVMGMVVPTTTSSGVGSGAEVAITGSAMSAWIEISTNKGWIALNPNPEIRPIPDELPEDPTTVSRPQSEVEPPPVDVPRVQDDTPAEAANGEQTPETDPFATVLARVVSIGASILLGLGLLASPFLSIVALKLRRRRQRRAESASPAHRVTGAWDEFVDSARDHGCEVPPSLTRREAAKRVPAERSISLAKLIDRAQYSPGEATEAQAEAAWRSVDQVRQELDAGLTRRQRIHAAISLSSLSNTKIGQSAVVRFLVSTQARRRGRG